jgi:predicted ATPase
MTSFIGRGQALRDVQRLFHGAQSGSRLVTLTGPGGSGKTRLALRVAESLSAAYSDGTWWVELAALSDPAGVVQAAGVALGLEGEIAPGSNDRLVTYLQARRLLLILDNCEHVVASVANLAAPLLQQCPGLELLVTSRESLGLPGEAVYRVPALSLPPSPADGPQSPEVLTQSEAVQLFVDRAVAAFPAFQLRSANSTAVATVCRQLDGLPLAIELAAARVPMLRVEEISARLEASLDLLRSRQRGTPARHQTLWATLDWSYDLLSEAERALLRRLSVFAGGWTLEAAAAVASGEGLSLSPSNTGDVNVLDLLAQLVDKSLVVVNRQPEQEAVYRFLETTRQYAADKLAEGADEPRARTAHLAYYVSLAERSEPALRGHGQLACLRRLDRDHDNVRAALAWAVKSGQAELALRLAGALYHFWYIRGFLQEGRRWLEAALALTNEGDALDHTIWRAKALRGCGAFAMWLGDFSQAQEWLEGSAAIYKAQLDKAGLAYATYWLAGVAYLRRDFETARSLYEASLALSQAAEDGWGMGNAIHCIGHALDELGDHAAALKCYEQCVPLLRESGDLWNLAHPLGDLAWQRWLEGNGAQARSLLEENLSAFSELGGRRGMAMTMNDLFHIAAAQGDYTRAGQLADELLALNEVLGIPGDIAGAIVHSGEVAMWQGGLAAARPHFDAARDIYEKLNDHNQVAWVQCKLGRLCYWAADLAGANELFGSGLAVLEKVKNHPALGLALLGSADVARLQGDLQRAAELYRRCLATATERGALPDMAEPLEGLAKTAQGSGQAQWAAQVLGAATALRDHLGTPVPPVESEHHARTFAALQATLGRTTYESAYQAGYTMGHEHAIRLALVAGPGAVPDISA